MDEKASDFLNSIQICRQLAKYVMANQHDGGFYSNESHMQPEKKQKNWLITKTQNHTRCVLFTACCVYFLCSCIVHPNYVMENAEINRRFKSLFCGVLGYLCAKMFFFRSSGWNKCNAQRSVLYTLWTPHFLSFFFFLAPFIIHSICLISIVCSRLFV